MYELQLQLQSCFSLFYFFIPCGTIVPVFRQLGILAPFNYMKKAYIPEGQIIYARPKDVIFRHYQSDFHCSLDSTSYKGPGEGFQVSTAKGLSKTKVPKYKTLREKRTLNDVRRFSFFLNPL